MSRVPSRFAAGVERAVLTVSVPVIFVVGMTWYLVRLPWVWWKHRADFSVSRAFGFVREERA